MNVDDAAERIYEEIKRYIGNTENQNLTEEKEAEYIIGVLKVFIKEVGTLAVVEALDQTKMAVDGALKEFREAQRRSPGLSKRELSDRQYPRKD